MLKKGNSFSNARSEGAETGGKTYDSLVNGAYAVGKEPVVYRQKVEASRTIVTKI